MKMKAALMYGPNDIRVEETDKPICPEDGLILKIMSVGLCGSDIRNLTTDSRKGNYPLSMVTKLLVLLTKSVPNKINIK